MNQPNSGSLKSMACSISPFNMEQRDLSQTTYHDLDIEHITRSILQIVLKDLSDSSGLSKLAQEISSLFKAEACVVIAAKEESELHQVGCWNLSGDNWPAEVTESLAKLPLLPEHVSQDSARVSESSELHYLINQIWEKVYPSNAWLGIVTQQRQSVNGLIFVSRSATHNWTIAEEELLLQLHDALAIAICQIQLQAQAQVKHRYQTLLKNLSSEISQGYQPQRLLQNCLAEICQTLEVDRGMILMLKYFNPLRAKSRYKPSVAGTARIAGLWTATGQNAALTTEVNFPLTESNLCQQAWKQAPDCLSFRESQAFPDLDKTELIDELLAPQGSALLVMPLMGKKTSEADLAMVLGLLILQQDAPRHWLKDELDLINWVAVQVSTAIIHHQTLNQVQLIVDEKTAQLKSSLDVRDKLSAKMRQHIEQLQQLNQLKDDFMNSMSHELKTPMTSMKMAIKMLRQTHTHPEMREKYLDILEQEWEREYSLIKDLLTLQQLEAGELSFIPQELNLQQTIAGLTHSFALKLHQERDIKLVSQVSAEDLILHTDAQSLENIINELLSNAGKYCDPHTTIKLSVSREHQQDQIVIAVANIGAGITPEELPHIFDKFRRGAGVTDRAVPGTGLGLTLVQHLVEHLNGTIEVTSNPVSHNTATFLTTFILKLPRIQPMIS